MHIKLRSLYICSIFVSTMKMLYLLILYTLFATIGCTVMDPKIPAYDFSQKEVLPGVEILSVDNIYTWLVN